MNSVGRLQKAMPRITAEEYRDRLGRLQTAVAGAGLDRLLVSSFDSIYYLTGAGFEPLERPFFLIVTPPGREEPALLVPRLDAEHMKKSQGVQTRVIHTYRDHPAPPGRAWRDVLLDLCGKAGRIGVEASLRLDIAGELQELSPVALTLIESLRLIKSEAEIAMIRQAARYADLAVQQLLDAAYRDATVAEGFARTGRITRSIIRDSPDWDPLTNRVLMATWAAPRSAQPHSIPSPRDRLGRGPHVALAFLRVNGYAAESERTFFTVRPDAKTRSVFQAMLEARKLALKMVRPGIPCGDIDDAVNAFLAKQGYAGEECRLHRTGHGIGLGNHEAPWVAAGSADILAENMVISIEPGIYLHEGDVGGFRHSDTILVTRDGGEFLTRVPSDLDSLTIRGRKPITRLEAKSVRRAMGLNERRYSTLDSVHDLRIEEHTMTRCTKTRAFLSLGGLAGMVMLVVGLFFHILVTTSLSTLYVTSGIFRPWPGWTLPYMIFHPLAFGFLFTWAFLAVGSVVPLNGARLGAALFFVGALPIYLLAYASITIPHQIIICWILQSFSQYLLAGIVLDLFSRRIAHGPSRHRIPGLNPKAITDRAHFHGQ